MLPDEIADALANILESVLLRHSGIGNKHRGRGRKGWGGGPTIFEIGNRHRGWEKGKRNGEGRWLDTRQ